MPFEPDIIVTGPEAPSLRLVIEAKLHADAQSVEQQLRRYMFGMRCPVGMLITLDGLRLYRDTYSEPGEESIELVGEFALPSSLEAEIARAGASRRPLRFEEAVQIWLERLAQGATPSEQAGPLQRAIAEHVLPALAEGEIRAAGPRWRRTGT